MNDLTYELPEPPTGYNPNEGYIALRPLYKSEMESDSYKQIAESIRFKNTTLYISDLEKAVISWTELYAKEWRNRRNYERFYKK